MIESIKIKLNGETQEISLDEARKLNDDLSDLFNKPFKHEYIPPVWGRRDLEGYPVPVWPPVFTPTCGGTGDKTIYQNPRSYS